MEAQISSYEQKIVQSESYCNHSFFSALLFSMYICAFQHRMWDKIHDSDLSWFMERRKRTWSAGAGFGSSSAAKRCTISSLRLWETCTDVWKISMCARTETHTQHTQPGNFFFTNHRVLGRLLRFLAHSVLFFFSPVARNVDKINENAVSSNLTFGTLFVKRSCLLFLFFSISPFFGQWLHGRLWLHLKKLADRQIWPTIECETWQLSASTSFCFSSSVIVVPFLFLKIQFGSKNAVKSHWPFHTHRH